MASPSNPQSITEKTRRNENLAGPNPHIPTGHQSHSHQTPTMNNEPITAHTVRRESDGPLEKDFSTNGNGSTYDPYHMHLDATHDSSAALRKIRTAGSVSISPELFEKLYLSPPTKVHGDLRKTLGNPTPIALIGFLLSLTPLSMDLMGWRGATGTGMGGIGLYIFFGGVLSIIGSIGEFIIGNTFPFVVFGSFGAFWLGLAATLQPFYNAYGAYSADPEVPAKGLESVGFRASYAFFFLAMALMCLVYLVCSIRTNMVFFMIFFTLLMGFCLLAAANFQLNNGDVGLAGRLQQAGGAFFFVTVCCGWWIFAAIMLASLDFPFAIPVGDLSGLLKGASERKDV